MPGAWKFNALGFCNSVLICRINVLDGIKFSLKTKTFQLSPVIQDFLMESLSEGNDGSEEKLPEVSVK